MASRHRYFTCEHRGGLKESLDTERPLTYKIGRLLIRCHVYLYYGYDKRLCAKRYLLREHHLCLGMPTWINVYDKPKLTIYD